MLRLGFWAAAVRSRGGNQWGGLKWGQGRTGQMENRNCRSSRTAIHFDNCDNHLNDTKTGSSRRIGRVTALQ